MSLNSNVDSNLVSAYNNNCNKSFGGDHCLIRHLKLKLLQEQQALSLVRWRSWHVELEAMDHDPIRAYLSLLTSLGLSVMCAWEH